MLPLIVSALLTTSGSPLEIPEPVIPAKPSNLTQEVLPKISPIPNICSAYLRISGSIDECKKKALAALSTLKKFQFIGSNSESSLCGYTDTERWLVLFVNCSDDCMIVTTITSWNLINTLDFKAFNDQFQKVRLEAKPTQQIGTRNDEL